MVFVVLWHNHTLVCGKRLFPSPVCEWPRLQSSLEKPHWLRVDFEHWEDLSDEEDGKEEKREKEDRDAQRERMREIKKKQVFCF